MQLRYCSRSGKHNTPCRQVQVMIDDHRGKSLCRSTHTVATEFMVYFGISKFWCNFRNLYTVNCTSEFLLYTILDVIFVFPTVLCFLLHSKKGCSGQVLWVCLPAGSLGPRTPLPKCVYRFWQYTGGWNIDHLCIRLITCLVNTDCE